MGMPDANRAELVAIKSSSERGSRGEQNRAEPPPQMHTIIRVRSSAEDAACKISLAPETERASATGWEASLT